ncbi:hypothetical protein MAR_032086 [Mya arenaria]|uniref:Uncharacterized protein n=1 Tax=Mya arenaria TaxID=6604 RepID=A0ABY7F790_MYAAR|nr:hypothetical protein MAR_032086 [Mya arenaria]
MHTLKGTLKPLSQPAVKKIKETNHSSLTKKTSFRNHIHNKIDSTNIQKKERKTETQRKRDKRSNYKYREAENKRKRENSEGRKVEARIKKEKRSNEDYREFENQRKRDNSKGRIVEASIKKENRSSKEFRDAENQRKNDNSKGKIVKASIKNENRRKSRKVEGRIKKENRSSEDFREAEKSRKVEAHIKKEKRSSEEFRDAENRKKRENIKGRYNEKEHKQLKRTDSTLEKTDQDDWDEQILENTPGGTMDTLMQPQDYLSEDSENINLQKNYLFLPSSVVKRGNSTQKYITATYANLSLGEQIDVLQHISDKSNLALRKTKRNIEKSAGDLKSVEKLAALCRHDKGYKILEYL